ncbi:MAG: hypothetical protein QOH20_3345 [Mycobacterium sp.]|jgi:hypothetical protein|nr:hypothetical protein [Mycobacterium sp.]
MGKIQEKSTRRFFAAAAMATGTAVLGAALALGSAGSASADQNVVTNTGNKITPGLVNVGVFGGNLLGGLGGLLSTAQINLGTVGNNAISQTGTAGTNAISQTGTAGTNAISQTGAAGNGVISAVGTAGNNVVGNH